jgi:hypothetical protein
MAQARTQTVADAHAEPAAGKETGATAGGG